MRSEESREQQLHGGKGETIFCPTHDTTSGTCDARHARRSSPAIPPQERNPHQNSPRHCKPNPRKREARRRKRGKISRTHHRARGGGAAAAPPVPAAASRDVAAAGVAGGRARLNRSRRRRHVDPWRGIPVEQVRLLPRALLPLRCCSFFFFPSPVSRLQSPFWFFALK